MGAKSRCKGRLGEQQVVKLFSEYLGINIGRNLQQSINGGHDLDTSSNPLVSGLSVEVKRYKAVTDALIDGWWQQAERQAAAKNLIPVLFYRADRQKWKVVIDAGWLNDSFLGENELVTMGVTAFFYMVREGVFVPAQLKVAA